MSGSSRILIFVRDRQVAGVSNKRLRSFPWTSPSNKLSNFCPLRWYLPRKRGQTLYALTGDHSATWAMPPNKRPFPSQSARCGWPQLGHLTTRRASQSTCTCRTCRGVPTKAGKAAVANTRREVADHLLRCQVMKNNTALLHEVAEQIPMLLVLLWCFLCTYDCFFFSMDLQLLPIVSQMAADICSVYLGEAIQGLILWLHERLTTIPPASSYPLFHRIKYFTAHSICIAATIGAANSQRCFRDCSSSNNVTTVDMTGIRFHTLCIPSFAPFSATWL